MKRVVLLLACAAFAGGALADDEIQITPNTRVGGNVRISEPVEGPLRAVGGNVTVDAPVNGDVYIVGGNVVVERAITGKLRAVGGDVRVDGPVTGDVSVSAGTLELGPNARIEGRLKFHGDDLQRDPAAQVTGGIEHKRWSGRHHHHERTAAERFLHGWIWSVGLMVLAGLIAAALPGASHRMASELRERPWLIPLLGLVALTAIPIAAVLLMITIIGIPIGLLALIGYAALLLLGYVWIAVVVGGMLLDRVKPETAARAAWQAGSAILAMLVLAVLVRVPFVGGLVKLGALVVGVGMIVAVIARRWQPAPASPAAA